MTEVYLAHLEREGYSSATLEAARRWLTLLEGRTGKELMKLRAAELTDFERALRWEPGARGQMYSENTVNQAVDVVRRFYGWAVEGGLLSESPAAHLKTRRVPRKPERELSTEAARELLARPNLGTFTGCRDRAILGLVLEHRTPHQALARAEVGHFCHATGALLMTGRRRGILSLSDGLADDIERYLTEARSGVAAAGEQALFVGRHGHRLTAASFGQILGRHA